jgi:antibiotic biosynthesis monooxygenase (ABM) superfamily enzyme
METATTTVGVRHPVSIVLTRRVRQGKEAAYEEWLKRQFADAEALPGYMGAEVERPSPDAKVREYTTVVRFDSVKNLRAFEHSEMRRKYLAEVVDLVEGDASWHRLSGLEFWFTPPKGTVVPQPSRFRMWIVTMITVYLLVMTFGRLITMVLADTPFAVRMAGLVVVQVTLMTYVFMPRVTRLMARWIYPAVRPTHT